jgi:hypothetical protein
MVRISLSLSLSLSWRNVGRAIELRPQEPCGKSRTPPWRCEDVTTRFSDRSPGPASRYIVRNDRIAHLALLAHMGNGQSATQFVLLDPCKFMTEQFRTLWGVQEHSFHFPSGIA